MAGDKYSSLLEEIEGLKKRIKEQEKQIQSLNRRLETRVKREKLFMKALSINNRTKQEDIIPVMPAIKSILGLEDTFLDMQKKIANVLRALKNHRESIIRLNRRVYREDSKKMIELDLEIMENTLAIMAMNGMPYNTDILDKIDEIEEMLSESTDMAAIKKKKRALDRIYEREREKFDIYRIHESRAYLPGYH